MKSKKDQNIKLNNLSNALNNKKYIEEKKFVLFNVVSAKKSSKTVIVTGERTSIGYMLSYNRVYDFISSEIYQNYDLNKIKNETSEKKYALITKMIFEKSKKKILLTMNNYKKIEKLFEKYIEEYNNGKSYIKEYNATIRNSEHTPYSKKKTID